MFTGSAELSSNVSCR